MADNLMSAADGGGLGQLRDEENCVGGGYGSGGEEDDGACEADDDAVKRLRYFALSDNVYARQNMARNLLGTLRVVWEEPEDVATVVDVISRLAEDPEASVRAELMEQVPHVAIFCQDRLPTILPHHLVPAVVHILTDSNNQVRKTSQAAVLVLLEQGLLTAEDVEEQIFPVILELADVENADHYRTEAVALMSKMAPLLGRDLTERLFLHHFASLCADSLFNVRKVCAANFGDVCSVVGTEATEEVLLQNFVRLCSDNIWGVRKACADVFVTVSCVCSRRSRNEILASIFSAFLADQSKWVRMAAFQALGPFISTFADPSKTGVYYSEDGIHSCPVTLLESDLDTDSGVGSCTTSPGDEVNEEEDLTLRMEPDGDAGTLLAFDSFSYWRVPIPELELDPQRESLPTTESEDSEDVVPLREAPLGEESVASAAENLKDLDLRVAKYPENLRTAKRDTRRHQMTHFGSGTFEPMSWLMRNVHTGGEEEFSSGSSDWASCEIGFAEVLWCSGPGPRVETSEWRMVIPSQKAIADQQQGSDWGVPQVSNFVQPSRDQLRQNIVPIDLLEEYVCMVDPMRAQNIDNDITKHCAYSLPGVALTLGRTNWHILRDLYAVLAADLQWKVRRTLAFSIHELAAILGPELTASELLPILHNFVNDVDEVRVGILHNFSAFLKVLPASERQVLVPKLEEFLRVDNPRNWRYRWELSDQVSQMASLGLFSPQDIRDYLLSIALVLLQDKVSTVRQSAHKTMATLLGVLSSHRFYQDLELILANFVEHFGRYPKWSVRQTFVYLCAQLIEDASVPMALFAQILLPALSDLANDGVPSVRMIVAKVLNDTIRPIEYFRTCDCNWQQGLQRLQEDKDRDVRFCAGVQC